MEPHEDCREAIEKTHGGSATFRETVRVVDTFKGKLVWQGNVHVFDLAEHPHATEAYAWDHEGRIAAVIKAGPVQGPLDAFRAAMVAQAKQREADKFKGRAE